MAKKKQKTEQLIIEGVAKPKETPPVFDEQQAEQVSEGQVSMFDDSMSDTMIDETLAREKLNEAIESQKPKKKKKSLITNLIFFALNITVMAVIINTFLKDANGLSVKDLIAQQGNKLLWLLLGLGLFCVMFFADTMMFFCLIKKSTGKRRIFTSYKVSTVGKYFDAITPFSVGGQPSQILNLTRAGVSPGIATSIPIIKLIIYNLVYTFVILCFLIFGVPFIPITSSLQNLLFILFKIFAYIGLIFTALTSVLFILIGSGKIVGRTMVRWICRLGYKLHIVKDYRKSYNKFMSTVLEYQSSIKYLKQNKGTLFACIFFGLVEALSYFAIPFAVVMALTPANVTGALETFTLLLICMTKFIVCQMAAVVIPLPGGTGMMELSFMFLFSGTTLLGVEQANVVLGLLFWRFLTYYFTIVQGFIVSTVDSIVRMVKARREGKSGDEAVKKLAAIDGLAPLGEGQAKEGNLSAPAESTTESSTN